MGCDIHSVAQIKKDGHWVTVESGIGGDDRNYNTFAVLANVRNGSGFAGVKTGEGWKPISEPRGMPEDFVWDEDSTRHEFGEDRYKWMGDHSHSWLLLSEISTAYKDLQGKAYERSGLLERSEWEAIQKGEIDYPREWCGDCSGPNVVKITEAEAKTGMPSTHVWYSWKLPALYCLSSLYKIRDELLDIKWKNCVKDEDVRFVFGFDS
jgi:hypothetical protein